MAREELSLLKGLNARKHLTAEERKRKSEQFWASRPAAGYILAGGASSRFGQDKALADLCGKAVLERMLELLKESEVHKTIVVGPRAKYGRFEPRCIKDRWPGEGPLGGIITALRNATVDKYGYRWCLILSCDMPFLSAEWLRFLIERAKQSDAEVVIPKSSYGWEPLCACWRTEALAALEPAFERGVRKVTDGIALLRAEVLDAQDWKRFDTDRRLFWNMNTQADYEEAQRILQAEQR